MTVFHECNYTVYLYFTVIFKKGVIAYNFLFFSNADLLFDIIKNLQFVTKQGDQIILKQGEQGDW